MEHISAALPAWPSAGITAQAFDEAELIATVLQLHGSERRAFVKSVVLRDAISACLTGAKTIE